MTSLPRVTMNHPIMQQSRQDRLEQLYRADGRHIRQHPMYGRYTGLEVMARWREGCLATPVSIDDNWRSCMVRRICEAKNNIAFQCELEALNIFYNAWDNKLW